MPEQWTKALKESISDVFSTMFFIILSEDNSLLGETRGLGADGWLEGWLEMTHPQQNTRIWVWIPQAVGATLASNLLSVDPEELDPAGILDAFREMLNMVAGKLLTAVDQDGEWQMGLPNAAELAGGVMAKTLDQARQTYAFEAEEGKVLAGISITAK